LNLEKFIMIVRIDIDGSDATHYDYTVRYEAEDLYADAGLASVVESLVGAVEGLPPEAIGVEVAYQGVVSGTYPLQVLAMNLDQVAAHAVNTTEAISEARG
jgi:hypothetical protein